MARTRKAAVDDDTEFLEAVVKESMRLHPVIPMVARHLMAPATIGGVDLPRGTNIGPSILIGHAREDNHRDASSFRPERFLEGEVATNTWIPFGGGVRRCIGAAFAEMEMRVALAEILRHRTLRSASGNAERVARRNVTFSPAGGTCVIASVRHPVAAPDRTARQHLSA